VSEASTEWDCVADRSDYVGNVVLQRDQLAEAARGADWQFVLATLDYRPAWVNAPRIGGSSGDTPLHHAARYGADQAVIERLRGYGAWLTLRNSNGSRALDLAKDNNHQELVDPLTPLIAHRLPDGVCEILELHLHQLMTQRVRALLDEDHPIRLPQLEPLTELTQPRMWCPVPGMNGGFDYELDGEELLVDSFSRVIDGSHQKHRVNTYGAELTLDGGF
jgi:hypothetical protein